MPTINEIRKNAENSFDLSYSAIKIAYLIDKNTLISRLGLINASNNFYNCINCSDINFGYVLTKNDGLLSFKPLTNVDAMFTINHDPSINNVLNERYLEAKIIILIGGSIECPVDVLHTYVRACEFMYECVSYISEITGLAKKTRCFINRKFIKRKFAGCSR